MGEALPSGRTATSLSTKSKAESLDDFRWRVFMAHQPNSTFFVGVKTTKIYCLSDCPARRARRANVVFFDDATQAMAKGFRACKRCKPSGKDDGGGEQHARRRAAMKAKRVILRNGGRVSWKEVCKEVGLSERYLFESFKGVVGVTPGVWAEKVRRKEVDDPESSSLAWTSRDTPTPLDGPEAKELEFNLSEWISSQELRECLESLGQANSDPIDPSIAESLYSGTTAGTPFSDTRILQDMPYGDDFDDWLLAEGIATQHGAAVTDESWTKPVHDTISSVP